MSMPVSWTKAIGNDCNLLPIYTYRSHSCGQSFSVGSTQISLQKQDDIEQIFECIFTVQVTTPPPLPVLKLYETTATVLPSQVIDLMLIDIRSNENGVTSAIASMTITPNTFSSADIGATHPVILTVVGYGGTSDTYITMVSVVDATVSLTSIFCYLSLIFVELTNWLGQTIKEIPPVVFQWSL